MTQRDTSGRKVFASVDAERAGWFGWRTYLQVVTADGHTARYGPWRPTKRGAIKASRRWIRELTR